MKQIRASAKITDEHEIELATKALIDFSRNSYSGQYSYQFERQVAERVNMRSAIFCNSGSSANLLALSALCQQDVGKKKLQKNDVVITIASGFPTTVNPIIQNGLIPFFCDVELPTYNININQLEDALRYNPKAIMIAHTLGNPFDIDTVLDFATQHKLHVISDCCDAFGSLYKEKPVESYFHIATHSYYPAHVITTMGEGGMVLTKSSLINKIVRSLRDWGRSCWCSPGKDNTCGLRFEQQFGDLPFGYDHKYIYDRFGYNLKSTDVNAAFGLAQLDKLDKFIEKRSHNHAKLHEKMRQFEHFFILPEAQKYSNPAWFGFCLTIRPTIQEFTRKDLINYLEEHNIETRLLFGGNLLKQPAYRSIPYFRTRNLFNSNLIMNNTFWIGCHPGIDDDDIDYIISIFDDFLRQGELI